MHPNQEPPDDDRSSAATPSTSPTLEDPPVGPFLGPNPPPLPPPLVEQLGRARKLNHPHLTGKFSFPFLRLTHGIVGHLCDEHGNFLPLGTAPAPRNLAPHGDWRPFPDASTYGIGDFLYREDQMSNSKIDELMWLWAERHQEGRGAPFRSHKEMHTYSEAIQKGEAPWRCFKTVPPENLPDDAPSWKTREYEVWYRDPKTIVTNILDSPEFKDTFDASPYQLRGANGKRRWTNFMSGNYSWRQSVSLSHFRYLF